MKALKREKGWKVCCVLLAVLIGITALLHVPETAAAAPANNAYDFYQTYGNQVIFQRTSVTDGNLLYGTRGKASSAGVTYSTIGWKVSVYNRAGNSLQSIYYSLSGSNIVNLDYTLQSGYKYNLYAISLSNLKSRMNAAARNAMEMGDCNILLDACMVVKVAGNPRGGMNDGGPSWGTVYTTYEGIVNAQDWSGASRETLKSGFHKAVEGLMFSVRVNKGAGISSVSGGGYYCYGTKVTIRATAAEGYQFSYWIGDSRQSSSAYSFYVNSSSFWTAFASPRQVSVAFYRNQSPGDQVFKNQVYTYGTGGQRFFDYGWRKTGHHALGWSAVQNAKVAQYSITCGVSNTWIVQNSPTAKLYCIWEPNSYRLEFDGNGAETGSRPPIRTRYGQAVEMPDNGFSYGEEGKYSFLGWSTNPAATEPEYKEKESCPVNALVEKLGLENTDNGVITLYAVWDEVPSVAAVDLYYSLEDARSGKITEEEISSYLTACDREDGEIAYGVHERNSFCLRDYKLEDYLHFEREGSVTETCVATDSSGNKAAKTFTIHLVDTKAKIGKAALGRLRFISACYYKETDSLPPTSVWRTKNEYRMLLESALDLCLTRAPGV